MSKTTKTPTAIVPLDELKSKHALDGFVALADHPFTRSLPVDADDLVDVFFQSAFEIHAYRRRPHNTHIRDGKRRLAALRELLQAIQVYGFDPAAGHPVEIRRDRDGKHWIGEGRHRCSILYHIYGGELALDVRKGVVAGLVYPPAIRQASAGMIAEYHAGGTRHVGRNAGLYQTIPQLGIPGRRDTRLRLKRYGLAGRLSPTDEVIDIGCNCGAILTAISPLIRAGDGVDNDRASIHIANRIAELAGRRNLAYSIDDADYAITCIPDGSYTVVLSFAAHRWLKTPLGDYGGQVDRILRPGGFCIFESHKPDRWDAQVEEFAGDRLVVEDVGQVDDPSDALRKFVVLRKPNA